MVPLALLKQERRARGWTQHDLALRARITVPTLRGLEAGRGTLRSLVSVMRILDLAWGWAGPDENAAAKIAARRREKGLTQAELAKRAHCSRPTIIALERGLTGSLSILMSVLSILGIRQSLRSKGSRTSGGLVPPRNAPARDIVMTPPDLAAAILAHFEDRLAGSILDPARGRGAFFDTFPDRLERHWCELAEGRDFLNWSQPVDWIITNPPWSRLREFNLHAMSIASHIVWLTPIVNLTTKARLRDLDDHGFAIAELLLIDTPKDWPQSGFQLAAAYLKKEHSGPWQVRRLMLPT